MKGDLGRTSWKQAVPVGAIPERWCWASFVFGRKFRGGGGRVSRVRGVRSGVCQRMIARNKNKIIKEREGVIPLFDTSGPGSSFEGRLKR